jgi:helix-turn-helix protein
MMQEEQFYTVEEFAKILKINRHNVRLALRRGIFQGFKPMGGIWRIPHSELGRLQTISYEERIKALKQQLGEKNDYNDT